LRALIFDVDGTLAETEETHRRSFNDAFAAAGLTWRWNQSLYTKLLDVAGGKERIRHYIECYDATPRLDDAAIAALHREKTKRYTDLVEAGEVALRPGIKELLREAPEHGMRLAIATTTSRPNVDALLHATLGTQPFEVIAAGDEVPKKKPAPDVYKLALQRLDLPPENCVAIEDTLNGLRSALAAGLACIVTPSMYGGLGPFPGALQVVDFAERQVGVGDIEAWMVSAGEVSTTA
jgi:HAD superfamily hydrolase (TIGR01509 family)